VEIENRSLYTAHRRVIVTGNRLAGTTFIERNPSPYRVTGRVFSSGPQEAFVS